MKMDVSKFKKISSDDKKTVFRHPNGHKIVVAHAPLGKKLKEGLDKLPMYSEGGGVEDTDQSTSTDTGTPQGPVQIFVGGQAQPQQAQPQEIQQADSNRAEQAQESAQQTGTQPPAPAPQAAPPADPITQEAAAQPHIPTRAAPDTAPEQAPEQNQAPVPQQDMPPTAAIQGDHQNPDQQAAMQDKAAQGNYQKGFQDYYHENAQKLGMEDAAWQHDLANGHVTPETYGDLFAKRDTLGKIGMAFGMLMAGAGSGLTHQPNSVLAMMNQEIQNDYNAQMQSKGNAQNFVKLHQQQALNDAHIKLQGQQGKLTEAEAKAKLAEADITAQSAALMKMNRTAFHDLARKVDNMPPGPQRTQAEQALAMTGAAIDAKNYNIADVASSRAAFAKMLGNNQSGGMNTTLLKTMPGMEGVANDIEQKTIPGVGQAQIPVPQNKRDELQAMNTLDYKVKDLLDFAKKNKGSLSPSVMAQGKQKSEELINYYNASLGSGSLTAGRLGWLDSQIGKNPTSVFQNVLGNNAKLSEIMQSNAQRKNILLGSVGAPQSKQSGYPIDSETVSVIAPDGRRGSIPKANLKAAMSKGYKAAN